MNEKKLPEYAVKALARGDSAIVGGEHVMPEAMPTVVEMMESSRNYAEVTEQFKGELDQRLKQIEDQHKEIARLKAEIAAKK